MKNEGRWQDPNSKGELRRTPGKENLLKSLRLKEMPENIPIVNKGRDYSVGKSLDRKKKRQASGERGGQKGKQQNYLWASDQKAKSPTLASKFIIITSGNQEGRAKVKWRLGLRQIQGGQISMNNAIQASWKNCPKNSAGPKQENKRRPGLRIERGFRTNTALTKGKRASPGLRQPGGKKRNRREREEEGG